MSLRVLATFGLLMAAPMSLQAGLYNPAEPGEDGRTPRFVDFEKTLFFLRTISAEKVARDNPLRMRYLLMADTSPKSFPRGWSAGQQLSIEAYLIRRRKFAAAIELITPHILRERSNFLQTSNLAMAYFLDGQEPQRAIDYLAQAIDSWPASIDAAGELKKVLIEMDWSDHSLKFYKSAEQYLLKLFRLRYRERLRKAGDPDAPDSLFDVKFVGESGKFEPAKLAAAERAKLPAHALEIVQQLLLWMPDDPRLYWLLGELYNARAEPGMLKNRKKEEETADLAAALRIFNELAGYNGPYRVPALSERWQVLRTVQLPETDLFVPETTPGAPRLPVDWNALAIGFGAGAVVALLAYWQFRELRRRRQR